MNLMMLQTNRFIKAIKKTSVLGFLLLPITLIFLGVLLNLFAPSKLQFPNPLQILSDIVTSLKEKTVLDAIFNTLTSLGFSIAVSLVFGTFIGLFIGFSEKVWNIFQPIVDFFRSIPVTFLIPAVALLIGHTAPEIVWILAIYPCMLIIIFSVRTGIKKQEPERIHQYYIISGSKSLIIRFFKVTFIEILPDVFAGFRIAISYCLVIVTVLEYMKLGNVVGIGGLIDDEIQQSNYTRFYSLTIIIGIVGFLLNKLTEIFQNNVLHWNTNK